LHTLTCIQGASTMKKGRQNNTGLPTVYTHV